MCLSWALVNFVCVFLSFFGIEGGIWYVIVLIPDHCLSIYFTVRVFRERLKFLCVSFL